MENRRIRQEGTSMTRHLTSFASIVLFFGYSLATQAAAFRVTRQIDIGGEGGWDYLTPDPARGRLFVTHGMSVVVVDEASGRLLGEITDTPRVHGVELVESVGKGFTTNGGDNSVTVFDLASLTVLDRIAIPGSNPDAVLYEPVSGRLFAFNGESDDATAIDPRNHRVIGSVGLGGKPETGVADGTGRVFINIEDTNEIKVFDARTLEVKQTWSLAPCEEPTGLALDSDTDRLFVACGNERLAIVNADTGAVITTLPVGAGCDGVKFDAELGLAFASAGEDAELTIVRERDADNFEVLATVPTQTGARTLGLDPRRHEVYLSTAVVDPLAPHDSRDRPGYQPDSFMVLVVARD
jgi:DNA-binding beta-propeller fold protein YncE